MSDRIYAGSSITVNSSIVSTTGKYTLLFQHDGNLVLYKTGVTSLWATGTVGRLATDALMRSDGNFVLYDINGRALWSTGTAGHPGAWLLLQNDGNLVVYDYEGRALWASHTVQNEPIDIESYPKQPASNNPNLPSLQPAQTEYTERSVPKSANSTSTETTAILAVEAVAEKTIAQYKKMRTKAKLFKNGLLVIETFSENKHPFENLHGKVQLVYVDNQGQAQILAQEYSCSIRGSKYNPTRNSQGVNVWFEQLPASVGLQTSQLEIYQYDCPTTLQKQLEPKSVGTGDFVRKFKFFDLNTFEIFKSR